MTKYLFVINPASGKGKGAKLLHDIKNYLQTKNISFDIKITEKPTHATEIVQRIQNEYEIIVSVGGDGTLNEVINGIEPGGNTIIGVLPVGSGNDFALNLGLEKKLFSDLDLIISESKKIKLCDVCELEYHDKDLDRIFKKRFVNNLGFGFDAQVAFINQHKKVLSGITSYIIAVLRALMNYKPIKYSLKSKDVEIKGEKLLLTFGNGVSSGGGFYLTPNAKVDDNLLDFTTIDFINRINLLKKLPMALLNKLETVKEAKMYKTEQAELLFNSIVYVHTDGEASLINTDSLKVRVLEKKVKFITRL